ncbi:MAG: hypothetical protein RL748_1089, partial [Pseudomonadota bacterium]
HLRADTPISAQQALYLDQIDLSPYPQHNPVIDGLTPENAIYVIYTSGSTGNPKGVVLSHAAVANTVYDNAQDFDINHDTVFLQTISLNFDASSWVIWMSLTHQAQLVVANAAQQMAQGVDQLIDQAGITHLMMTPSNLALLTAQPHASLHTVIVGGDSCSQHLLESWQPFVRFFNGYGPTETAICATVGQLNQSSRIHIGRPLSNTRAYIVDRFMNLVPAGVAGELLLGGAGLARGYLHRPELTAEKFINTSFLPGQRLYRSGDLVRWLPDGNLEILGRIDSQVKIRGLRIELGEIEHALNLDTLVRDALVLAKPSPAGHLSLVAYVVPASTYADAASWPDLIEKLVAALGLTLPEYMVPAAFVCLQALPLTPNGKIDRRALPEPTWQQGMDQYVAPQSETEIRLCQMWQELLGLERVGLQDNFFQLGGHSLLATRLLAAMNQAFQVSLPLKTLFAAPTIAALLPHLQARLEAAQRATGRGPAQASLPALRPYLGAGPLLPSYAQQRLWLLDQIEGGSSHYNMPSALDMRGALDVAALTRALHTIVERHQSLRTCFSGNEQGQVSQLIQSADAFTVRTMDLSQLSSGEQQMRVPALLQQDADQPFDLSRDLMLRASLLKLAPLHHVLLINMHHIASDGWSMSILIDEFCRLYQAAVAGTTPELSPLPVQYADYAQWQRQVLQGELLELQLSYWTRQLASLPEVHSLPLDAARPQQQTFVGAAHRSQLDSATTKGLLALCQASGATLFMGLHAAFSVLLARHSNETDIVVGSPIANREQAEVAGLIGFFVNTLVLRADLSDNPSFAAMLAQSRRTLLDAYAHQQVPFEQIVERLLPKRSQRYSPLFQIMLVLQNNSTSQLALPGLQLQQMSPGKRVAKYDLTLNVSQSEQGLALEWEYNADLFGSARIEAMARHFTILLDALVRNPQQMVFEAEMLDRAEQLHLLHDWNQTARPYNLDLCIHELVEAQVEKTPDAMAVYHEQAALSYAGLNRRANQLAHYLMQERQVQTGDLVGICVERSLDVVVGILAILKTGATYVPLDPNYPAERLAYMVQDARVDTVLTQSAVRTNLDLPDAQVLCLDHAPLQALLSAMPADNIARSRRGLTPGHLAYLIYTSGSTGNPKGVMIEHRNAVAFLHWALASFSPQQLSCVLAATSMCFDLSIYEMFAPLSCGGSLLIVKNILALHPYPQHDTYPCQISLINTVPSAAEVLIAGNRIPASVTTINLAGEALKQSVVDSLYAAGLQQVYDLYGPSEDTTYSTWVLRQAQGRASIGKPIHNTQAYVLNAAQQLVPDGVPGELYLGGAGLARGYLHRPDLTAEKFIANPFYDPAQANSSLRLYRTADLVRWLPNGELEYLGRCDHQVKIRGFRIELGEIEHALSIHPEVLDVVVMAKTSQAGDACLVAYLVLAGGLNQAVALAQAMEQLRPDLLQHLGLTLPEFMFPAAFVALPVLPLTPNGKVDRKALPEPEWNQNQGDYRAPQTDAEQQMCQIWQEVLGLQRVGMDDNFFQLGGHSLLATRLLAKVNRHFGVKLNLRTLFSSATVAQLVAELGTQTALDESATSTSGAIAPGDAPLSSLAQQRLWMLDQIDGSSHYNMPLALRLVGTVDALAIERALDRILARHDSLRTSFANAEDGLLRQVVQAARTCSLAKHDLSGLAQAQRQSQLQQLQQQEAERPFDLQRDLLMRASLVKLQEREHVLLITLHYIVADEVSMQILLREFATLYPVDSHPAGAPALPALPMQYAAYAMQQRQHLQAEGLAQQLGYWKNQLQDLPQVHALPLDRPRPREQSYRGASLALELDAALCQQFQQYCRQQGASLLTGLHAALSVLLARTSNQNDIVIGSPVQNREQAGAAQLIGLFANNLVLRSNLEGEPGFAEVLARSMQTVGDALAHQQMPFDQLVEHLQPQRNASHAALFQIMLTLQEPLPAAMPAGALQVQVLEPVVTVAKYDLSLNVTQHASGLRLNWVYNRDLFDAATMDAMHQRLQILLAAMLASPAQNVFSLACLQPQEQQLLASWNQTAMPYAQQQCLHQLFEEQVQHRADARALSYAGQHLSFAELNQAANRLAHYLLSQQQVQPESLIGICLDRSLDLVVSILAVWKAGAAYVPLDPAYPSQRLAYMIEDARLSCIITRSAVLDDQAQAGLDAVLAQVPAIYLDQAGVQRALQQQRSDSPSRTVLATHLAYVIYTSGSTGQPKGVMVEHHSVVNLAQNIAAMALCQSGQAWGWNASFAFDG